MQTLGPLVGGSRRYLRVDRQIHFPRVADQAPERPAPELVTSGSRGETILLVDDDSAIRHLARQILASAAYHVLEAANADDATTIAESHASDIHLLVTDVFMPGVSGRSLAYRLLVARPDMKVLFMSGYTEGAVLHHGILAKGVAFLQKPFTPATFRYAVRQALDSGESNGHNSSASSIGFGH